ncbi:MAG: hypothetical protein GY827_04805 [Cytophagales bacterium]|nr:hypothetical protein [Cytophagales bacterium]
MDNNLWINKKAYTYYLEGLESTYEWIDSFSDNRESYILVHKNKRQGSSIKKHGSYNNMYCKIIKCPLKRAWANVMIMNCKYVSFNSFETIYKKEYYRLIRAELLEHKTDWAEALTIEGKTYNVQFTYGMLDEKEKPKNNQIPSLTRDLISRNLSSHTYTDLFALPRPDGSVWVGQVATYNKKHLNFDVLKITKGGSYDKNKGSVSYTECENLRVANKEETEWFNYLKQCNVYIEFNIWKHKHNLVPGKYYVIRVNGGKPRIAEYLDTNSFGSNKSKDFIHFRNVIGIPKFGYCTAETPNDFSTKTYQMNEYRVATPAETRWYNQVVTNGEKNVDVDFNVNNPQYTKAWSEFDTNLCNEIELPIAKPVHATLIPNPDYSGKDEKGKIIFANPVEKQINNKEVVNFTIKTKEKYEF